MSRIAQKISMGALIAIGVWLPATSAQAQSPAHVRVAIDSARIMRWLGPQTDVVLVADQGTILEVLDYDRDEDAYWVVLPRDVHGTRKAGWIHASLVESSEAPAAAPSQAQADDAQAQAPGTAPSAGAAAESPAADEDKVTISVRRDSAAASSPEGDGGTRSHAFEDLHFERDSFSIRSEDIDRLRVAVTALKDDPALADQRTSGRRVLLGDDARETVTPGPVIPQHVQQVLPPVVVVEQRGIEAAAVEGDGVRPWPVDARTRHQVVVKIAQ